MNHANAPLSKACASGYLDMVYTLHRKKFANVNNTDHCGITPLAWAAKFNRIEVMKYLIDQGAIIDHRSSIASRTPLQVACAQGNKCIQAVALLLQHGASLELKCTSDVQEMNGTAFDQASKCINESKRLLKMLKARIEYLEKQAGRNKMLSP